MHNDQMFFEDDATAFARYLDADARKHLARELNPVDRIVLEQALDVFRLAFNQLGGAIEPTLLRALMASIFVLGKAGVLSEEARALIMSPIAEQKREAGRKSGESRLAKRPWVKHARELAIEIRAANPKSSQDEVATEIMARWKDGKNRHPGHPTLKKYISELEAAGVIPRRS
jgi:hypothetical protein